MKAPGTLGQSALEWRSFLEFTDAYFRARDILRPVIVEIGVLSNAQRPFYRELLNAEHIGIDVLDQAPGRPDIVGDSRAPETLEKLRARLAGRPIDLLFIDGNHLYEYVKFDYENYGPLARHLIAFHDVVSTEGGIEVEVNRLWREICEAEKKNCMITFYRHNDSPTVWAGHEMGIGLIVKDRR